MALTESQKERVQALSYDEYVTDDEEETRAAYEELLSQIESPEELHEYAKEFNWDCGCKEMRDVVRHPLCDLGTALLIYWYARPGYFLKYTDRSQLAEYEIDQLTLIEEIEQRVGEHQYTTATQPFDPRNEQGTDWTTLYDEERPKKLDFLDKVLSESMAELVAKFGAPSTPDPEAAARQGTIPKEPPFRTIPSSMYQAVGKE